MADLGAVPRHYWADCGRGAAPLSEAISEGREALICTTRELLTGECASSSLELGNRISARLIAIVRAICVRRPRSSHRPSPAEQPHPNPTRIMPCVSVSDSCPQYMKS